MYILKYREIVHLMVTVVQGQGNYRVIVEDSEDKWFGNMRITMLRMVHVVIG